MVGLSALVFSVFPFHLLVSPWGFGFTLPNALQLLLFIVANPYRTSFLCTPDTVGAPPSPPSFLDFFSITFWSLYLLFIPLCLLFFDSHTECWCDPRFSPGLPLGAQWLRICLPVQET